MCDLGQVWSPGGTCRRAGPVAQREQEARDPLPRGLAAEQQHLRLGGGQLAACQFQQAPFQGREVVQNGTQPLAREAAVPRRADSLGAQGVGPRRRPGHGKPEDVPAAGEAGDLAPPIRQRPEQPGRPGPDAVEAVRRFALGDEELPWEGAADGCGLRQAPQVTVAQRAAKPLLAGVARRARPGIVVRVLAARRCWAALPDTADGCVVGRLASVTKNVTAVCAGNRATSRLPRNTARRRHCQFGAGHRSPWPLPDQFGRYPGSGRIRQRACRMRTDRRDGRIRGCTLG